MKKFTAFIILLALTLSVNAQTTGDEQPQRRALFERKNKDIPADSDNELSLILNDVFVDAKLVQVIHLENFKQSA